MMEIPMMEMEVKIMIKRFKKNGMKAVAMCLISLLLMGSIFVAGASQEDYPVEDYYVDEETALKHAVIYLEEFVADGTSGLEAWDGATVQKDPVTIYDIHEKKLFYEFTVTKDGKAIGEMEMAASKVLGCLLNRIIVTEPIDRISMEQKAIEIVKMEYPGWEILSTKPVCYSYPKEGMMATLVKPGAKEEKTVILDTYTSSEVPLKETKKDGDIGAWSIYDKIPDKERAEMVQNWNELQKISATGKSTRGSKTLSVQLYAQEYSNWCAAAVGQMIGKYYGYTHPQSTVADYMGLDPGYGGGASISDQLVYYKYGINKVYSHGDSSPSFSEEKTEINANRPFMGGIVGHARCGRGYSESVLGDYIYINDPWPVNIGVTYWEWWGLRTHDDDIHVL